MLEAIKHGLGNLFNGDGRDARQAFWYYVLFIYLVTIAITAAVVVPIAMQNIFAGVRQGIEQASGQDPLAAQAAVKAAMLGAMSRIFPAMMWVSIAVGGIMLASLAASFVRRLHDSGLSGHWVLLPAVCQTASLALMPAQFERMQEDMQNLVIGDPLAGFSMMSGAFGIGTLLAWVAIGIVVILGVRKSTPGPNSYGDAPFVA